MKKKDICPGPPGNCRTWCLRTAVDSHASAIRGVRRATATFVGGVMTVTVDNTVYRGSGSCNAFAKRARRSRLSASRRHPLGGTKEWFPLRLHSARLELASTVLTLVFMIAGWIGHHAVGFSDPRPTSFKLLPISRATFLRPSRPPVLAGKDHRRRSVDGACRTGAAVVDHPFEGAMLLFSSRCRACCKPAASNGCVGPFIRS